MGVAVAAFPAGGRVGQGAAVAVAGAFDPVADGFHDDVAAAPLAAAVGAVGGRGVHAELGFVLGEGQAPGGGLSPRLDRQAGGDLAALLGRPVACSMIAVPNQMVMDRPSPQHDPGLPCLAPPPGLPPIQGADPWSHCAVRLSLPHVLS